MSSATTTIDPAQRAFVLITGASRGIGRAIAIELARFFTHPAAQFVLVARDAAALQDTRSAIQQGEAGDARAVHLVACDLAAPSDAQLEAIFAGATDAAAFDVALCVHNVGTIGTIERTADRHDDVAEWQRHFALNVFGVARLNVRFLAHFAPPAAVVPIVVNVTSKAAEVPFASFTQYCASRAAREMYFRVLALERPDVRVLNYSPGVVDTAMTVDVQARSGRCRQRDAFRRMRDEKKMLRPQQTAEELRRVLAEGGYASGEHVDYYGLVEKRAAAVAAPDVAKE